MIYLSTDAAAPTAPLWLFHLPTFTLAQLRLSGGPGGNHLLTVAANGFAPDEALTCFVATLESMAPGASEGLATICREDVAHDLPPFLQFVPENRDSDRLYLTLSEIHGYAHVRTESGIRIYWREGVEGESAKAKAIEEAAASFDEEFLRQLPRSSR